VDLARRFAPLSLALAIVSASAGHAHTLPPAADFAGTNAPQVAHPRGSRPVQATIWEAHALAATDGGFAPSQRLLFGGEWLTIAEAQQSGRTTVTVLAPDATVDHLTYDETPITAFHAYPYHGGMVRIETWEGTCLSVTKAHPVLLASGEFISADRVAPEMLVLSDTGPARVMATRESPFEGTIWQVGTVGGANGPHTLISEHLLTTSVRAQPPHSIP
jgi:hypothetical protein